MGFATHQSAYCGGFLRCVEGEGGGGNTTGGRYTSGGGFRLGALFGGLRLGACFGGLKG